MKAHIFFLIFLSTILTFINAKDQNQAILITGGAGYIGSHTAYLLTERGYDVIILDNNSHSYNFPHEWATGFITGNCGDKKLLDTIFSKYTVTAVMHFSAFADVRESVTNPLKYYKNNVSETIQLLESMISHNINNFIFSSTCAVYGIPDELPITEQTATLPINPYGRSKLMIEHILEDFSHTYDLKYISLRYFNVAGAFPEKLLGDCHKTHVVPILLDAARHQKPFTVFGNDYNTNDKSCVRDYIHVLDIAHAHYLALEHLKRTQTSDIFNLGTGKGNSVKELITTIEEITGLSIKATVGTRKPGEPPLLIANAEKAFKILGWKPQYSLVDIIKDAYAFEMAKLSR